MTLATTLFALACRSPVDSGLDPNATVVGNPGKLTTKAAPSEDTENTAGRLEVVELLLEDCEGGEPTGVPLGVELDIAEGQDLELPAGEWCFVELFVEPPLAIEGVSEGERTFVAELVLHSIVLTAEEAFRVDENAWLLELGAPGWLSREVLGLDEVPDVVIDEEHEAHDRLAHAAAEGSGLFADTDEDGDLDDDERDEGTVARGPSREEDTRPDDEERDTGGDGDTGCGSGSRAWLLGPLVLLFGVGRRELRG